MSDSPGEYETTCTRCRSSVIREYLLLTREQAAEKCQVSLPKLDEWSWQEGFPVIRGPRFVRIHAGELDKWLAARAVASNPAPPVARARPPMPGLLDGNNRRRKR